MKPNAQSIPSGQKNGFFDEENGQAVSVTTYLNTHEGHTNTAFLHGNFELGQKYNCDLFLGAIRI